jgi:hypothetical protein
MMDKKPKQKRMYYRKKCIKSKKALGAQIEDSKQMLGAFIGSIAQAPLHLVDNEFITRGYRIGYTKSIRQILKSLF